jgi:hypothetical protein
VVGRWLTRHPKKEIPMEDPKDPKMSGRIAMIALLVAFGIVGMLLWFACPPSGSVGPRHGGISCAGGRLLRR